MELEFALERFDEGDDGYYILSSFFLFLSLFFFLFLLASSKMSLILVGMFSFLLFV